MTLRERVGVRGVCKDLLGQQFGRLLVIERTENNKWGRAVWICKCSCGNIVKVKGNSLLLHKTKSCGCLRRDTARESNLGEKANTWNGGKSTDGNGYIRILAKDHPHANARGYVMEHILIAERALGEYLPEGSVIHHINGVRDDNRLENLWWFPSRSEHVAHHHKIRKTR
jgi:hypothetical protein